MDRPDNCIRWDIDYINGCVVNGNLAISRSVYYLIKLNSISGHIFYVLLILLINSLQVVNILLA